MKRFALAMILLAFLSVPADACGRKRANRVRLFHRTVETKQVASVKWAQPIRSAVANVAQAAGRVCAGGICR